MLFSLYGENTLLAKRKLNEIIEKYRSKYKSGLNLIKIEANEENFEKLKDAIETISMFQEKKLIILENLFSSPPKIQEKFYNYLEKKEIFKNDRINVIIFEKKLPDKKLKFFRLIIKKSFKSQEFPKLNNLQLKKFIKKEVESLNGKIQEEAIDKLIFHCNSDIWQIENEIKKLIAFKEKEIITTKDVEDLCVSNFDISIFETIESIAKKQKQKAINLLMDHFKKGENELKILAMINFQFRNLIKVKSLLNNKKNIYQIQKITGLHPFVVRKTVFLAKNFNLEELKNIYKKLFETDLLIKTGKIDPKIGIEKFIAEI